MNIIAQPEESIFVDRPISPIEEMGAYEYLWLQPKASFRRIADLFREQQARVPSDLVPREISLETASTLLKLINEENVGNFGVRVNGAGEYPQKLRDADHPVELLYFQGYWELVESRSVAVVGSRKPSQEGARRAERLVRELVENDFTVVSGLASGIDSIAHKTALDESGRTIAVIGTPITDCYPKENRQLQRYLAANHLVVSQVPILAYRRRDWRWNRSFFPERNKTMSALSLATVIVEASETSGTLIQARAALAQGRKLFILDNCFENSKISWPQKFLEKGAIRVRSFEDIKWGLDGV